LPALGEYVVGTAAFVRMPGDQQRAVLDPDALPHSVEIPYLMQGIAMRMNTVESDRCQRRVNHH
jgi:hypothetical protein